ncbi:hypothetical protein [Bradyrhizobium sp.]|uniref:hypothetical protein n=1 Tax=Bradyrhizobium sp. TaxID=376 RepID=UPI003BB0BFD2
MKNQVVSYDHWLCLAAAPTFAIMALLTNVLGSGQPDMLCSAAHGVSSLSGMVPMYLLMSAFHVPPWLRLISGRRSRAFRVLGSAIRAVLSENGRGRPRGSLG